MKFKNRDVTQLRGRGDARAVWEVLRVGGAIGVLAAIVASASAAAAQTSAPLRLRDAVAEALRRSPELRAADDQVTSARLQQRQAAAPFALRWNPAMTSGSAGEYSTRTYGATVGKRLVTGTDIWVSGSAIDYGSTGSTYTDRGYSIGVTQPITALVSGAAAAPLETARRTVARTERDLEDARRQLVVTVAEAFYAFDMASRLAEASRLGLDRARTLVTASQARAEAGLDTELDVMRASLLASQAETALSERLDGVAAACERLNMVIGRSVDRECAVAIDDLDSDAAGLPNASASGEGALDRRVDVQDARLRVQDAKRTLDLSKWNLLPPLDLSVEYTQRGFGSGFPGLFRPFNGWHVTLSSSYQIDRASQSASVAAAELALRAAERDVDLAEQRATADMRQAHRGVARADHAAVIQHQALEIARRQIDIAKLRYERGLADNLSVIDAENAVFQAESAAIAADVKRRLARLRLQRATGTLDPARLGS